MWEYSGGRRCEWPHHVSHYTVKKPPYFKVGATIDNTTGDWNISTPWCCDSRAFTMYGIPIDGNFERFQLGVLTVYKVLVFLKKHCKAVYYSGVNYCMRYTAGYSHFSCQTAINKYLK